MTLDHIQRSNLHALLGAQRGDVVTIRSLWSTQDKIALDEDEAKALEMKCEMLAGQERVVWNPTRSIAAKEFEFSESELVRISAAIQTWDSSGSNADRRWLQPLVESLSPTEVCATGHENLPAGAASGAASSMINLSGARRSQWCCGRCSWPSLLVHSGLSASRPRKAPRKYPRPPVPNTRRPGWWGSKRTTVVRSMASPSFWVVQVAPPSSLR